MNQARTDSLVDELETRLQGVLQWRVRDFHLSIRDDGLVLFGQAHTYYDRQFAQHAVMKESDLPIVANEIEIC